MIRLAALIDRIGQHERIELDEWRPLGAIGTSVVMVVVVVVAAPVAVAETGAAERAEQVALWRPLQGAEFFSS